MGALSFPVSWSISLLLCILCTERVHAANLTATQAEAVRQAVVQVISDNRDDDGHWPLIAGFVRLAFHDCAGGCDGCINTALADNAGLTTYIEFLEPLYTADTASVNTLGVSRADLWALAAIEATKMGARVPTTCGGGRGPGGNTCELLAETDPSAVAVNITWSYGRVDCATAPYTTADNSLPDAHRNNSHSLEYFSSVFGFSSRETVCIMGAHTLGEAHPTASGFRGPWVGAKSTLNNQFYTDLIGPTANWIQRNANNATVPRNQWNRNGQEMGGGLMLNTDIAIYKDLSVDSEGLATCNISTCPDSSTIDIVREFADNNQVWIDCFGPTFQKMLESAGGGAQLSLTTVSDSSDNGTGTLTAATTIISLMVGLLVFAL